MAERNEPKKGNPGEDGIDYDLEGNNPAHEKDDPTAEGYDEAAHSGASRYAIPSGAGGVFGTTGGGGTAEGFQVVERPGVYDRSGVEKEFDPDKTDRMPEDRHIQVIFENDKEGSDTEGEKKE